MIRQNCKIQELDSKAAALLNAGRLSDEEIEKIASGPHMMASVWSRIEAEKAASVAEPRLAPASPFLFGWRAAFAALPLLILAAVGTAVIMRSQKQPPAIAQVTEQKLESAPSAAPTPLVTGPINFPNTDAPQHGRPRIEHAVFRPEPAKAVQRRVREAKQTSLPPTPPLEFYTLPAVQVTAEAVKDARIVRVELPRASLVALGANIPLEGDKQLVRADLLVGSDGVPRAIRLAD